MLISCPRKLPYDKGPFIFASLGHAGCPRSFSLALCPAIEHMLMASGDADAQRCFSLCCSALCIQPGFFSWGCLLMLLDLFQVFQAFFAFLCFPWQHTDACNCVSDHSKILSFAAGPQKKYLNSEFGLRVFFFLCASLQLSVIWDINTLD